MYLGAQEDPHTGSPLQVAGLCSTAAASSFGERLNLVHMKQEAPVRQKGMPGYRWEGSGAKLRGLVDHARVLGCASFEFEASWLALPNAASRIEEG